MCLRFTGIPFQYKSPYVNTAIQLPCGDAETPTNSVEWSYRPTLVASSHHNISTGYLQNGDFGGRVSVNGSSLIIENAQEDDSGVYTCFVAAVPQNKLAVVLRTGNFSEFLARIYMYMRVKKVAPP